MRLGRVILFGISTCVVTALGGCAANVKDARVTATERGDKPPPAPQGCITPALRNGRVVANGC